MENRSLTAIAIVGVGAVLPDAPDVKTFWENLKAGRYSISEVPDERWDQEQYYNSDPLAKDKTYSRIGGWVREWEWDPLKWRLPLPPKVSAAMDYTQIWALVAARQALMDYGFPERPLNGDRTAVIFGNAMAGDRHYQTALRINYPEYATALKSSDRFKQLPETEQHLILRELFDEIDDRLPPITEDTMPGELANIISGRVANLYNFHGPNYSVDAACASAMAAMTAAIEGLAAGDYDAVVTGGVDANMSASTFTKFCKIGALSATGTRPFGNGADGFVMGEGAAVFLLKRLDDAERDGDTIYAVIRGIGGASDGKGKGITAPNPIGQQFAVERGWARAGLIPDEATFIEAHGTSTRVGDVIEFESLAHVFSQYRLPARSIPLGSVKSNIGHLKGAAGAAGILKAALCLHHKTLVPTLNASDPNPNISFDTSPFYVNDSLREWSVDTDKTRRAGVSAFGFGGTNFHTVLEEYVPGNRPTPAEKSTYLTSSGSANKTGTPPKLPLRGIHFISGASESALFQQLDADIERIDAGWIPETQSPDSTFLEANHRLAVDFSDTNDLKEKLAQAQKAAVANIPMSWRLLRPRGIVKGSGPRPKVAFLYTGQGSQYANMLRVLREREPIVRQVFDIADETMAPILGMPLSDYIFVDPDDEDAMTRAEANLKETEITQPTILATDYALDQLLAAYGIRPDMVMGHSLGEYAALVAAGTLTFPNALRAVSARAHAMKGVAVADNGRMAAVFAPVEQVQEVLDGIEGYVVIANLNSNSQSVIGGVSDAIDEAVRRFQELDITAALLPVSHAFHTEIVGPASKSLGEYLSKLDLQTPSIPVISNVSGQFYPQGPDTRSAIVDILAKQLASPVQFIDGLQTLYNEGVRVFVEVGPKRALAGFVENVFDRDLEVIALYANHPKIGDEASFNQTLCGLYANGIGVAAVQPKKREQHEKPGEETRRLAPVHPEQPTTTYAAAPVVNTRSTPSAPRASHPDKIQALGQLFADFLDKGKQIYEGESAPPPTRSTAVCVTGAALGLPGTERVFDRANLSRILRGQQFIDAIPMHVRKAMVDKNITRLVKEKSRDPHFETITSPAEVIKLAGRAGAFDLGEFGIPEARHGAIGRVTGLAVAVGLFALQDAGIPLVMRYKTTTTGTQLPERWGLPDSMRDDTGVIFSSAFPTLDPVLSEAKYYHEYQAVLGRIDELEYVKRRLTARGDHSRQAIEELEERLSQVKEEASKVEYQLDRQFLFRILSMGHAQFAEHIGARGPNTQLNSACASTSMALATAQDWIQAGRCRRVIIVSADDVTTDNALEWIAGGFLASGAAATDELVEDAALPFDKRRHGMIVGMGAAALVVERTDCAAERGLAPICDVLSTDIANSAFHGTRLDLDHICSRMEALISGAEVQWGIDRHEIADKTVFVSHETYTPARGGSAQAEINALRFVFGPSADKIVMANTKGYTGHAMGTGIEEVVAVKILETGIVPPVANFKEIDPDLGSLNLSVGGKYPAEYTIRLGAGFGSQISMALLRRRPAPDGAKRTPENLGFEYRIEDKERWSAWMREISGSPAPVLETVDHTLRIQEVSDSYPTTAASNKHGLAVNVQPAAPVADPVAGPTRETGLSTLSPVETEVLGIVSEITGYPVDMLDPSLDMEADLGIDTVKQAETFAAIREHFGIDRDDTVQLRDFPSLHHVIGFVLERRPDLAAPIMPGESESHDPSNLVSKSVVDIVSTITGYPADMLSPDLDMEADLGIDTVKQAETFAAIREHFGIERDDTVQLRDFPTLHHVIGFVLDRRPDLAVKTPVTAELPIAKPQSGSNLSIEDRILQIVSDVTGYPVDMLDPELDMEADLGIDTVKQAETFAAVREEYGIAREDSLELRAYPTLVHVIQFVKDRMPETVTSVAPGDVNTPTASGLKTDQIEENVLRIASDVTGYPPEMLDMDLDLEADLGIDTVKQAEMFAAIRGSYGIERDDTVQLRDFPTLAHVARFARERSGRVADPQRKKPGSSVTPPTVQSPANGEDFTTVVLNIAAEQTGYPPEMLDLDLDLEADLGIDTVKQAEMFAAVRAHYGIERDESLQLREFPTLAHVIQFAKERTSSATPNAQVPASNTDHSSRSSTSVSRGNDKASVELLRRVPVARVRPPLNVFAETGINLSAETRIIVMPDNAGVGRALEKLLSKNGATVLMLDPGDDWSDLETAIQGFAEDGPVTGIYWLPALDKEDELPDMSPADWKSAIDLRVKHLFRSTKLLYTSLQSGKTFLIAGTRNGGAHGYDSTGALAPLGGAVTGFVKAVKREIPGLLAKSVDFEPSRKTTALAELLINETLFDPGIIEVGYQNGHRMAVALESVGIDNDAEKPSLPANPVFVITGAAGSIVSAIIEDLAEAFQGHFHLLDLADAPDPDDDDIKAFESNPDTLKRQLFDRLKAGGEKATPAIIERLLSALERKSAGLKAIRAIKANGGTVTWHSVDLRDTNGVEQVMNQIRDRHPQIDVLIHAAGLEISRMVPDKSESEYDLVFDVKATGWYNMKRCLRDVPPANEVVFSSIAGRFGNGGQTDYSAANDLLCKFASHSKTTGNATRGIALDWTAWGEIGMASRGSIPKMMALAGIDMLPPTAAIPVVRRELTLHNSTVEVVVAGSLGALLAPLSENGGFNRPSDNRTGLFSSGNIHIDAAGKAVFDVSLDPTQQPFLFDHQINGTAVLPGVMGLEAFSECASALFPDLRVRAISDVRFLAPFKFYRNQTRSLTIELSFAPQKNDVIVLARLLGYRDLPNSPEPVETVHFTGTIRLSALTGKTPEKMLPEVDTSTFLSPDDLYQVYFHGPAYQVVEGVEKTSGGLVGHFAEQLVANHVPSEHALVLNPRVIELCFQTAGVLEMGTTGIMGLPMAIDSIEFFESGAIPGRMRVYVQHVPDAGFSADAVDENGKLLFTLSGYRTSGLPESVSATELEPIKRLVQSTE